MCIEIDWSSFVITQGQDRTVDLHLYVPNTSMENRFYNVGQCG